MRVQEILELVDRVAEEVIEPVAAEIDRTCRWPGEEIGALLDHGLGGLTVPSEHGGLGQGLAGLCQVSERLARAEASTALCFGMHCVGTACIAAKATEDQVERFLEPIAAGEHLTTLALAEPGTGSAFHFPETKVYDRDGALELQGEKGFVTNGGHADSYVLSTDSGDPDAPPGHFSLVVVPGGGDGLKWGPPWSGWGMRGNASRNLQLRSVRIPRENLLGERGEHLWYVFHVVAPTFLVAMTGTYLGIGDLVLSHLREHLLTREHSHTGRALRDLERIQHRFGELWARQERTRRLAYWAAQAGDQGDPKALQGLMAAKAEVAHTVTSLTNDAMTMEGGRGYSTDSPLQRSLRDARAAHVMAPTTDQLYAWIGRSLLDVPLLGE